MKHWVFDLDGTLIDSHSAYFDSLQYVFVRHGLDLSEDDKKEVLRIAVKDRRSFFSRKLGTDRVDGALEMLETRLLDDHKKIKPFDGIPEVLKKLRSNNVKLAIWTAREMDSAVEALNHTGLNEYFSFYMSGSCVSNCKPDPEGLIRIAKQFECDPTAISMVGDHDNDMLAANACGARAIRALWHNPSAVSDCKISDFQFRQVESFRDWVL